MNIKQLVDRLNTISKESLEQSAALCMRRTHFHIEIEHWLLKLLERPESDVSMILPVLGVDQDKLRSQLNSALEDLKRGNMRAPSFSEHTATLLREAITLANVDFPSTETRSFHILFALYSQSSLNRLIQPISELSKISKEGLKELFESRISKASEGEVEEQSNSEQASARVKTKKIFIKKFTTDLTEQAKNGKIDPITGRDTEIKQLVDILLRRRQNNPILTGEAGVGKTAVVEGFALQIANGKVPNCLKNTKVLSLDLTLLQAGASVKGEFENRLKSLIEEIKKSEIPIILFVDEAHGLIGAGGAEGTGDAANILKPALARGELRTIAATTWAEYKKHFEKDPALTRRFQVVKVEEPTINAAIDMMRRMVGSLEKHHEVIIREEAIEASVKLSHKYISGRNLPDKCLSLLDTACARVALSQNSTPSSIEFNEAQIANLTYELKRKKKESQLKITSFDTSDAEEKISELENINAEIQEQWEKELNIVSDLKQILEKIKIEGSKAENLQIENLSQEFDSLRNTLSEIQGQRPLVLPFVDAAAVAKIIEDWTGIPAGKMEGSEITKALQLSENLMQKVIGQDHGIEQISQVIKSSKAQVMDENRPIGVFLLTGPSGVGKTETALCLCEELYGSPSSITVINMSEFKEEHKVSLLMGSPPGYVGYGEGGVLTEAVRKRPYSLVLLDEIEKAHRGVQDIFYQVFDKGTLKDGEGRDINFKNTVIVMTSNLATDTIANYFERNEEVDIDELKSMIRPDLMRYFKPAFLGRVQTIPYLPLVATDFVEISKIHLRKLQKRIKDNHNISLSYDQKILERIASHCKDPSVGARNITKILDTEILPELSNHILNQLSEVGSLENLHLSVSEEGFFLFENHQEQ